MKSIIRIFTIIGVLASSAYGQTTDTLSDQEETKTRYTQGYKNSIGFYSRVRLGILSGNSSTNLYPYRFYYRRYFGEDLKNAIRLGGRMNVDLDGTVVDGEMTTQQNSFAFRLGVGYERYHAFNDRFSLYYGAEGNYFRSWNRDRTTALNFTETSVRTENNFGISPLFGVEVRLIDRLSLSSEMMYTGAISFTKTETEGIQNGIPTNTENTDIGFNTRLNFPRALVLSFNF